jgi:hypothetical protein
MEKVVGSVQKIAGEAKTVAASDAEESKLIRRMQMMMSLVMQTVAQDSSLTIDEASQMIADARCGFGDVSGERTGLRLDLEAEISATDAGAVSDQLAATHHPSPP